MRGVNGWFADEIDVQDCRINRELLPVSSVPLGIKQAEVGHKATIPCRGRYCEWRRRESSYFFSTVPRISSKLCCIRMMVLTDLGFLVGAASAGVIILKGTHTRGQVEIACTKAGGVSTAGRGHGGFGCRTSKGEVECDAAGECIGKCQHCGTGEIGSIRGILRPSSGRKSPSTR
jgi:hypothetical protein